LVNELSDAEHHKNSRPRIAERQPEGVAQLIFLVFSLELCTAVNVPILKAH